MECRELELQLEALAEARDGERPDGVDLEAARLHLGRCAACRELLALARLAPDPGDGESLTAAVEARTSGGACGRAESLLLERAAAASGGGEAALLAAHLERCAPCRELGDALALMAEELPRMAELAPDRRLVDEVLRATSRGRAPAHRRRSPRAARTTWRARWRRLLRRPRFAIELAYAATAALAVLATIPGSPFASAPRRALEATVLGGTESPAAAGAALEEGVAAAGRLAGRGPELLAEGDARLRTFWSGVASLLENDDRAATPEPASEPEETP